MGEPLALPVVQLSVTAESSGFAATGESNGAPGTFCTTTVSVALTLRSSVLVASMTVITTW